MSCFQEESDLRNPGIAPSNGPGPNEDNPTFALQRADDKNATWTGYRDTESRIGDAPGPYN